MTMPFDSYAPQQRPMIQQADPDAAHASMLQSLMQQQGQQNIQSPMQGMGNLAAMYAEKQKLGDINQQRSWASGQSANPMNITPPGAQGGMPAMRNWAAGLFGLGAPSQ